MIVEPIKFLVVDDNDDNLMALELLLRREELEILSARSGSQALELLAKHDVALALLDVHMPDMDGFTLAELMRASEHTKHVPIIFLTAGARDRERVFKGYESGAVDVLFKPIDPHILKSKAEVFFELARQRRELATALRLNELFVGILGHDLRNPLNAMVVGSNILQHEITDDGQLRTLKRMASAGQRMTAMIAQLLDLTRARLAGGLGFARVRRTLDVAALVQHAVDELRSSFSEREVEVVIESDATTTGDADRLLQLFSNVIANALQHGAHGSPISISIARSEDAYGAREVVVRVQNRGLIPPDLLPKVFDPFRGKPSAPARTHGLGLGLFISQQIAIAHDGKIDVESNEAIGGTVFTVRLPVRSIELRPKSAGLEGATVLIVDDDEAIRVSLREAFEDEGYRVLTAANGRDALSVLTGPGPRPDIVILDLVLPVIDGAGVYEAMKADAALTKIPVIVSTGNPARAPSGARVMAKPLKLERLFDAVAEALPAARAQVR